VDGHNRRAGATEWEERFPVNNIALMARFNAWVNERVYACIAGLPDADYRKDRKAYFGSIHNTLNHLLVVDRAWTSRI
jgi:uncharacterized damage-inducible protein DinB